MSNNLVPYADMERMAGAIVKSNLFGIKTADQALALMVIAQAEGRHPGSVAAEYHIIQGRPSLKADAMLARFQAAGGKVKWTEYTDTRVAGIFSHEAGGSIEVDWTIERATAAKLAGTDTWKQYPRQMLRARVISEGIRAIYPGGASGIYTAEEVADQVATADSSVVMIDGQTVTVEPEKISPHSHGETITTQQSAYAVEFAQNFRKALEADVDEDLRAAQIKALKSEVNEDQIVALEAWQLLTAKEKSAIKKYCAMPEPA